MDLQLKNKTALVTGSTAGIGLATAKLLAKEGAKVYINGRTQQRIDEAVEGVKKEILGADIQGIAADFSKADDIKKLTEQLPEVDILINNLSIFEPKPFFDIPDEDWLNFYEVNVMSGVRLSRHYMPQMLRNNWGRIIFISSESALNIPEEMIHYGMTKTAELSVSRGLAELTKGTSVTVNSILPGPTKSEGVGGFLEQMANQQNKTSSQVEEEFFKHVRPSSLLQRFATVEEIANLIVYVASPLSSATNGASLRVDGGVVKTIA